MDITLRRNHTTLDLVFTLTVPLHDIVQTGGAPSDMVRLIYAIDAVFSDPSSHVETRLQAVRDFLTPMLSEAL